MLANLLTWALTGSQWHSESDDLAALDLLEFGRAPESGQKHASPSYSNEEYDCT